MMLMMTGHFSPKLVSKILRAVVQQKPVMKSMKACFPHSLSQNLRYTGLGSNGKYELKSAVLHNIDCNITAGYLSAHHHPLSCACSHCSLAVSHQSTVAITSLRESPRAASTGSPHSGLTRRPPAAFVVCSIASSCWVLDSVSCHEPAKQDIMAETQLARGCSLLVASKPSPRSARSAWIRAVKEPPRNLTGVGPY